MASFRAGRLSFCTDTSFNPISTSTGRLVIIIPQIVANIMENPIIQATNLLKNCLLWRFHMVSNSTFSNFDTSCTYALSLFNHGKRETFSLMLAPKISGKPSSLTIGLKHSVFASPLCGTPSTMKKWMFFVRPKLWKNSISLPTHSDCAEFGEHITMRLREALSLSCNSADKGPGWMSVGAKKTGRIGVRDHPRSLHSVAGIR